jgi:hypothetical protein
MTRRHQILCPREQETVYLNNVPSEGTQAKGVLLANGESCSQEQASQPPLFSWESGVGF